MKSMVFDTGPIISLATNNLLWILEPLKKKFGGKFYITESVKHELVDVPLGTKKFKFEAIQVEKLIEDNILEVVNYDSIGSETAKLLDAANGIFTAFNNKIQIVHFAEMSAVAAAVKLNADAIVIDEKTTRFLIENPKIVYEILRRNLHTSVAMDEANLKLIKNAAGNIKTIRSIELVTIAYENGILDKFITKIPNAKKNLLESVLWGVKLKGCAVSRDEIEEILRIEMK